MAVIGNLDIRSSFATASALKGVKKLRGGISGLTGNFSGAKKAVLGFAAAIGAGLLIRSMKAAASEAFNTIDSISKLSDEIGVSTEFLSGLQLGAGLTGTKVEQLHKGLQRLVRRLGEAKIGLGQGITGLRLLGLTADDVASMGTEDAFKLIAQRISQLPGPAEKAAAAYNLFGRQGQEMLTLLNSGAEGIDGFVAEADRLGFSFDRLDGSKVEQANDAVLKLKTAWKGIGQEIAIKISPLIIGIADSITNAGMAGIDTGASVSEAFGWIGTGAGLVLDVLHTLRLGFKYLQSIATTSISAIIWGLGKLLQGLDWLLEKLGVSESGFGDTLIAISEGMDDIANEQWEAANAMLIAKTPSEQLQEFLEGVNQKADAAAAAMQNAQTPTEAFSDAMFQASENAQNLIDKLRTQIETFGMSSEAAELFKLRQAGAAQVLIDEAAALTDQLSALEEHQKAQEDMASRAKSIFEQTRTPLEKFRESIQELNELFRAGALDADTFTRARLQAIEELRGAETGGLRLAGALDRGSAEARSTILRNRFSQRNDPLNRLEQQARDQVGLQQIMVRELQAINRQGAAPVAVVAF